MSLLSMTGFGEADALVLGRRMHLEIRSINHRYLEIRCRLPRTLTSLEPLLTAEIKERVQRGKVDLTLVLEETVEAAGVGVMVDAALAQAYWVQIERLAHKLGAPQPQPDLGLLLGLPEVVRLEESRWDAEAVWTQLRPALQEALTLFATSRRAEGEALGEDLRRRAATLGELQERVRQHAPLALRHHQQKLRERVSRLLDPAVGRPGPRPSAPLAGPADAGEAGPAAESAAGGVRLDEARLVQELALLADRLDVEEELTRLDHHLGSLSSLLAGEERGPFGRRLDFLVQELMREVNTIGSKGNDALIADLVVSMKSELERIREQVQNLE